MAVVEFDRASRVIVAAGALLGATAVAAGAFGAHGLKATLSPDALALFDTAARYQLIHAGVIVGTGLLWVLRRSPWVLLSAVLLSLGTMVFCGSLYGLALGAPRTLGMVAPLGGTTMIFGWLSLAVAVLVRSTRARSR
jgi:uncharacterized membrane protein YgdD (TMEM256/DUF423 family)